MRRSAQMQPLGPHCFSEIAYQVAMRAHLYCCPIGKSAVIHGETVVVFKNRHHIFSARFFEQACPCRWIEFLGLKHGNEILVTKLVVRAIGLNVMLVFPGARNTSITLR